MGALAEIDLAVCQNTDYSFQLGFANQSPTGNLTLATPFVFTGASGVLNVRQKQDVNSIQILNLTGSYGTTGTADCLNFGTATIQGVSLGTITILIQNSTTVNLTPGVWYYDLNVAIGGSKALYAAGTFTVIATVSR